MILTFEVSGDSMDIHFDSEGRDQLISLLARCKLPGDHEHLFRLPMENPKPGNLITREQFVDSSMLLENVTLYLMDQQISGEETE